MRPRAIVLTLLVSLGLAPPPARTASTTPAAAAAAPALQLAPCQIEQLQRLLSISAECGYLTVPENQAEPDGRQIRLFVARVPAVSRRKQADPLFLLAGGPGLGASVFYPNAAAAFARIRRDRDIILVDQRGTGRSNPLNCRFDEAQMWSAGDDEVTRIMAACRTELAKANDIAQFTTSVAVADLDAVRAALGLTRINLYGGSYGTRVAQHYARRYPQHTRALILDGVVPPTLALGPAVAIDAQNAVARILARCREDAACQAQFGDPFEDYKALRETLSDHSVTVSLAEPRSGKPLRFDFTLQHLSAVLRLSGYTADQAALLPLSLHLARREGNFLPLAAQFLLTTSAYDEVLSYGMHNSVVCTEDVPFFAGAGVERSAQQQTFMGTVQVDALNALCRDWPRGPMDADLHAPLASDVPALLLSGTADPVTPAAYGSEAARGFKHAIHLQLVDQGHGQLVAPCVNRLMAEFLDLAAEPADIGKLDTSCTKTIRPPPFFLSLSGPAP